jgi:3-methylfumaryl-CoA hydratase
MSEDFTSWIGRSVTREDAVTPRLLAEYRATMTPCLFEEDPSICPPGFHFALAPATPFAVETGPDGAERKGLFLPPISLPRRMWAGGSIETLKPLRLSDAISRTSRIADVKHKTGASGELCILSVAHEITANGALAVRERQDLVFRAASGEAPAQMPADTMFAGQQVTWKVEASPLLLFRFSAFTFNGHRIHYDLGYAAEEGYPGLLVHGPMQGALMLNLASVRLGRVPERFDYRCLAPLYAGPTFGVGETDGAVRIIRCDGVTTAEGRVHAPGT